MLTLLPQKVIDVIDAFFIGKVKSYYITFFIWNYILIRYNTHNSVKKLIMHYCSNCFTGIFMRYRYLFQVLNKLSTANYCLLVALTFYIPPSVYINRLINLKFIHLPYLVIIHLYIHIHELAFNFIKCDFPQLSKYFLMPTDNTNTGI